MGFAEVIKDDRLASGVEDYRERATYIFEAAQHLSLLLNDLIDLAKVENGVDPDMEEIDLNDAVASSVRITRERAMKSGVTLKPHLQETPAVVMADSRMVRQMLINLIGNAAKYAGLQATCEISIEETPDEVAVIVADDGPGMTDQELEQAMEPFSRLDRHILDGSEGDGLGLPLVKALIERHGGRLEMETAPSQGVCARLVFPSPQAANV